MLIQEIKNINSDKKQVRQFGLSVGGVLVVVAAILFWYANTNWIYLAGAGMFLIVAGLLFPVVLKPLQILWMTFAVIMGWLMTRIILGVLFYLILTTIGWIAKLTGKQFLELKWDRTQHTYWNYRENRDFDKTTYEKQF
ncbi:MAG: hypothetical protein DWQ05_19760 [Calditrichaeota bacterium]|nr:MAG: hypothetical protein DWQ05_19760 [Calditrichota bacterium]